MRLARENNPDVIAARKAWEAAKARIAPARAWPDPMVTFSREKSPDGEKMNHVMGEQEIPFPGKKRTEGAMQRHEAMIAESRYRAKALEVSAQARLLYYRLYRADRLVEQLTQSVAVTKATLRVAQSRLQTSGRQSRALETPGMMGGGTSAPMASPNQAMGSDVFSLMAELGQMENMLFEEQQSRALAVIELNSLLNRDLKTAVGQTSTPKLADVPVPLESLLTLAERHSPMYHASLHERNHARAMSTRAKLSFAPDFGVLYDRMSAPGGLTGHEAGLRLSVPIWITRPLGEVKEARAHLDEAEAMAAAMRNEVSKMVSMEFTETNTHLTLARNFQGTIVPAAESAFNLARRQYESRGGNFAGLLDSLRRLITARTEYHNQLYHYGEHWALLEQWVGAPLSSSPQEMPHE